MNAALRAAYAACERIARDHDENFPVASVFLPRRLRPHVAAVYAFARTADDFADEGSWLPHERLALLDRWHDRLHGAAPSVMAGEPAGSREIFAALHHTIAACDLPIALFDDLLSAFRQDVTVSRYTNWTDLLDYCRRSANPVGRIVLRIAGYRDERLDAWSDAICTALQVTNFLQDDEIDRGRGREYVFADAAETIRRARGLFMAGRPLCDVLRGRLRYELRATWLGGMRILHRLENGGQHGARPTLGVADVPWLAWRFVTWSPAS